MLPALTADLQPISSGLSVLLRTTLARLLPCLWWAAPPDSLFHLPPLVIMSGRPQSGHCSLSSSCSSKQRWCVFHTSRCSLTRALSSLPRSGLAPAAQPLCVTPPAPAWPWLFFGFCCLSCDRATPVPWRPWKVWWLIWGSDVTNTLHNQKCNTSGKYKCVLSNFKMVWTHFRKRLITVQSNYRCSSFRW